jgi:hypothetical protein
VVWKRKKQHPNRPTMTCWSSICKSPKCRSNSTPKDGKTTIYVLRELTGEQRDKYLNGTLARAKTDAEGKVAGVRDLTGYQAALLCLAMRRVEGGEVVDGKLVKGTVLETEFPDPGMVQSWPSRVQSKLFKRAQKMSGINEEEKPAAKN